MIQSFTLCLAGAAIVLLTSSTSHASSSFFTSAGCSGCHVSSTTPTCASCHAHGVHPNSNKNSINLAGATRDSVGNGKTSFAPGEIMKVTVSGGYRTGWARILLYDGSMNELARSTGTVKAGGVGPVDAPQFGSTTTVTFTTTAPLTPGTYTWNVAWYGNRYDLASGATYGPLWTPDPNNANHGREIVATNSFTVVAPAAPVASFSPASLAFGEVPATTTATLTTDIQNTGNAALDVTAIARCNGTSTAFTWTPDAPFSISAGGRRTVAVTYAPLTTANDSGCLQITSNAVNPAVLNVSGSSQLLAPVSITGQGYFPLMQTAYDSALGSNAEIGAQGIVFVENLNFNRSTTVDLLGGYNSGYTARGGFTVVQGTLTVTSGKVTIDSFVIS